MSTSSQKLSRIFVSHSHLDNDFGIELAQDLRRVLGEESTVWYDISGGLHGGDSWWDRIVSELTAREVFIVILSPDAITSKWVRREIDTALNEDKQIIPLLWRKCDIRADLKTIQTISFLPPKAYTSAFNELLTTLGLSTYTEAQKPSVSLDDPMITFAKQMIPKIEASFANEDWPDVIRKSGLLIKTAPGAITSTIYRMQGVALAKEGKIQQAQEALDSALALVSDPEQRLLLLSDYDTILAAQGQWSEILRHAREALHLIPNDVNWLIRQAEAQLQLERFEEAKISYEQANAIKPRDVKVLTFGKVLAKASQATPRPSQASIPKTVPAKEPSTVFSPLLKVGTIVVGRYEVTSIVSENPQRHVYQVVDREGYQRCWNCGSEQNAEGDAFCIDCGASVLNMPYILYEYPASSSPSSEVDKFQGAIVNTFIDHGNTYAVEQPLLSQNAFPNGVQLLAASHSDAGDVLRNTPNEDSTLVLQIQRIYESLSLPLGVFIVASGINNDDKLKASRMVIGAIAERITRELLMPALLIDKAASAPKALDEDSLVTLLRGAVEEANTTLCKINQHNKTHMSSTLTGCLIAGEHAYIVNVGDGRTYMVREGQIYQLTTDHSLVGQLVAGGLIEPDDVYTHPQRSQISRSLGDKPNVQVDMFKQQLLPGDILLSCSDGLWEMVRNPQIESILNTAPDPQAACTQLIEAANANGGEDNISSVVVFVR